MKLTNEELWLFDRKPSWVAHESIAWDESTRDWESDILDSTSNSNTDQLCDLG